VGVARTNAKGWVAGGLGKGEGMRPLTTKIRKGKGKETQTGLISTADKKITEKKKTDNTPKNRPVRLEDRENTERQRGGKKKRQRKGSAKSPPPPPPPPPQERKKKRKKKKKQRPPPIKFRKKHDTDPTQGNKETQNREKIPKKESRITVFHIQTERKEGETKI